MRINSIDYSGSIADGPGIRTVLFVQGCDRHCRGCHNPSTWDLDGGVDVPVEDLIRELRQRAPNRKLTISGGEPLLQAGEVIALAAGLPEFDIALYTGRDLEQVPPELLALLRYVKVGRFDEARRTTTSPYIGSTNQQFIELRRVRQ